jgi:lysophospholipase L1-like esterase
MGDLREALPFHFNSAGAIEWDKTVKPPATPQAMMPLYTALGNRDTVPCKVVWWGDSITEGSTLNFWWQSAPYRFQEQIRASYATLGVSRGGAGYLPVYFESPSLASPLSGTDLTANTGGTSALTKDPNTGLGARGYQLTYGAAIMYTEEFTSFDVHYSKGPFGNCSFDVTVDGVADPNITNINTNAAGITGGFIIRSATYTPGIHTVKIKTRALNAFQLTVINGVDFFYGDEAKGIHIYNAGKSGAAAHGPSFGVEHYRSLTTMLPDCVIVQLITNDAIFYSSPTTYYTDLISNFTNITTAMGSKKFTLVGQAVSEPNSTFIGGALWADYMQALRSAIAQFPNAVYQDLSESLGKRVVDDQFALWSDGVHASAKGAAVWADRQMYQMGLVGGGVPASSALHTVIDFGSTGEDTTAQTTVLDSYIQTSSIIHCSLSGETADHTPEDGVIEQLTLAAGNIVPGVSFDIYANAPEGTWGRYLVATQY